MNTVLTLEELRTKLEEMTKRFTGLVITHQVQVVENIKQEYPHRIAVRSMADPRSLRTWRFNCHAFTFGLWQQEAFWHLQTSCPDCWPDGAFVTNYLLPGMCQISETDIRAGNLVLYFDSERLTHSGVVYDDLIRSKWGDGHVWEHALFEVPKSYGERAEYYTAPPNNLALDAYVKFAGAA